MMLSNCPPPKGFKVASDIVWAKTSPVAPGFIKRKKRTGRRAMGVRYEKKVHGMLDGMYGECYFSSPWFLFQEAGAPRARWCQPDGLLILPKAGRIIIVEVKYQHTSDAWWQLRKLYLPVVRKAFGDDWTYDVCEVVKWYDPAIQFPERVRRARDLEVVHGGEFGVHIWKP